MTRNQRIGLLAAALVVAVVAFVIAQSGGDDNDGGTSQPAASGGGSSQTTDTTGSTKPTVFRINVKGGVVDGDTQTFTVKKNDTVRIDVTSDAPDQIRLMAIRRLSFEEEARRLVQHGPQPVSALQQQIELTGQHRGAGEAVDSCRQLARHGGQHTVADELAHLRRQLGCVGIVTIPEHPAGFVADGVDVVGGQQR